MGGILYAYQLMYRRRYDYAYYKSNPGKGYCCRSVL